MTERKRYATIDEYISTFPSQIRDVLERIRQTIQKAVPEATETISYDMPTFDLNGEHLVFFAGWKQHISLYPLPAGDEAFQQRILPYKEERSTLRFPLARPIPYDLVEQVATFLMKERSAKG
jgi:uncharacterized protein YdhG (YjbR/CyaY superfamily)